MRKIKVIILSILLSQSLVSCGKSEEVKNVESLISEIGSVTLEKENAIIASEEAYNTLIEKDKLKVENYEVLQSSRNEFNNIGKDFSDETKYCARAVIALRNNMKDPGSLEIHKIDFNDGEHKYAQIDSSAKNGLGGVSRSIYIITNDEDVIISGKPDDETYLYFIDNSEGTVSLNSKIEINYDEVMILVERYLKTGDKDYIGLDTKTIADSQTKIDIINTKIERVELLESAYDNFMEDQEDILEVFNDAVTSIQFNNNDKAKAEIDETLSLIDKLKNNDLSPVSSELEELKNKYAETMELCCNDLFGINTAMKNYDQIGLKQYQNYLTGHMKQASNDAINFIETYGKIVKEIN